METKLSNLINVETNQELVIQSSIKPMRSMSGVKSLKPYKSRTVNVLENKYISKDHQNVGNRFTNSASGNPTTLE